MKRRRRNFLASGFVALGLALAFSAPSFAESEQAEPISDVDIWRAIIHESIASYPHLCPCPYSPNRAGRACGTRSAYSRVGKLTCYVTDISDDQIEAYRLRLRAQASLR